MPAALHCLVRAAVAPQLEAELAAAENIVVVGSAARGPFMPTYTKQVRAALPVAVVWGFGHHVQPPHPHLTSHVPSAFAWLGGPSLPLLAVHALD